MRYFSREDPERGGVRRFVVSTYDEFWRRYKDLDHEKRHHYEIIRADRPCHLYYDLEYPVGANPEADGERATDALVALTLEDLAAHEGVVGEDGAPPAPKTSSSSSYLPAPKSSVATSSFISLGWRSPTPRTSDISCDD